MIVRTLCSYLFLLFVAFSCKDKDANSPLPIVTDINPFSVDAQVFLTGSGQEKGIFINQDLKSRTGTFTPFSGNGNIFKSHIIGFLPGNTYYIRSYSKNKGELELGASLRFDTPQAYSNGAGVTDIEGFTYPSIIVNGQEWMARNLTTSHYRDSSNITYCRNDTAWKVLTSEGAYTVNLAINGDSSFQDSRFGKHYNYYAVTSPAGLCPVGWHIPSDSEWRKLAWFAGMAATDTSSFGGAISPIAMEIGGIGDNSPNLLGFTGVLGSGYIESNGTSLDPDLKSWFWTKTENEEDKAISWVLFKGGYLARRLIDKNVGSSVRCVKD